MHVIIPIDADYFPVRLYNLITLRKNTFDAIRI